MNKYELVAHMANIIFILDHHEQLGTTKNPLLTDEFNRCERELFEGLSKKEAKDAT